MTRPALLSSDTAADIVGFDNSRIAPSFGRVMGPCEASTRNTARALSVRGGTAGESIDGLLAWGIEGALPHYRRNHRVAFGDSSQDRRQERANRSPRQHH